MLKRNASASVLGPGYYPFITLIFAFLIISGCGHAETPGGDDSEDTGTDTETETEDLEPPSPIEMNCDDDPLFDYAVKTYSLYYQDVDGKMTLWDTCEYEYDELKRRHRYAGRAYQDGVLAVTYEGTYYYDGNRIDRIEGLSEYENETEDLISMTNYYYDDEGRISKRVRWHTIYDETMIASSNAWEYGPDGTLLNYIACVPEDMFHGCGETYEYDDLGRYKKQIKIDGQNDWAPMNDFDEYFYDSLGRVSRMTRRYFEEQTGEFFDDEVMYSYYGDTGFVSESVASNDAQTTYEWEDLTLTIIKVDSSGTIEKYVYEFTDEGNSALLELFPIPPATWPLNTYGNGYINGCIGQ